MNKLTLPDSWNALSAKSEKKLNDIASKYIEIVLSNPTVKSIENYFKNCSRYCLSKHGLDDDLSAKETKSEIIDFGIALSSLLPEKFKSEYIIEIYHNSHYKG